MSEIKCILIILALKMCEETISVLQPEFRRVILWNERVRAFACLCLCVCVCVCVCSVV